MEKNSDKPRAIYKLHFTVPGLPKTTNAKRGFSHWGEFVAEATKWKKNIIPFINSVRPHYPLERAHVTCIRHSSSSPDYDGLVSSFKHILDALVDARVLMDDKMSVIGAPLYQWKKTKAKAGYIEVIVEEIL